MIFQLQLRPEILLAFVQHEEGRLNKSLNEGRHKRPDKGFNMGPSVVVDEGPCECHHEGQYG